MQEEELRDGHSLADNRIADEGASVRSYRIRSSETYFPEDTVKPTLVPEWRNRLERSKRKEAAQGRNEENKMARGPQIMLG